MKIRCCLLSFLVAAVLASAQTNADAALGAARHLQEAQGDYPAAIQAYKKILTQHAKNRPVVAKALVRMAECYQKMGDAESRRIYERIVREFPDQKDEVAVATARLASGTQPRLQTDTLISRWAGSYGEYAVTPDGRFLVAWDFDKTGELVLRDYVTGVDTPITNYKQTKMPAKPFFKEDCDGAAISRDGKQLAYQWNTAEGTELRLIGIGGTNNSRRLFSDPSVEWLDPHDWSPDGRLIAVEIVRKDKTGQVGVISVADGSLRVVKQVGPGGTGNILFSPDGNHLAYDPQEPRSQTSTDISVVSLDGSRNDALVSNHGQMRLMAWAPDGRILFASDRSGAMDLHGMPVRDGKPQGPSAVLKVGIGAGRWIASMGLTRAGALFYARESGGFRRSSVEIASFDPQTAKAISPGKDVSQDSLESNASPFWSVDGEYIAYRSDRGTVSATSTAIVIRSVETGQVVRQILPKMSMWNFLSSWAPDGRAFVIRGLDLQNRWGSFEVNAQTGDVAPLHIDEPGESHAQPGPAFSPDGKSYYYHRGVGTKEVAIIQREIASGTDRELIRRPFLGAINVSPDGRYIATPYVEASSNTRSILLIPTAGGEPHIVIQVPSGLPPNQLTSFSPTYGGSLAGNRLFGVRWAADSRSFLIGKTTANPAAQETWRVPVDGSQPVKLDFINGIPSPDGRRIVREVTNSIPQLIEIRSLENVLSSAALK